MVTLATAVNASATTWALSEALPLGTEYIQVDDELVAVITPAIRASQRDEPTLFCEVQRGTAGEQEAHAQGATLTTLENPPLGGGSGEQTVRMLGPLHVKHDDPGIQTTGVAIGPTLAAGAWLIHADVFITENFDGVTDDNFTFDVGLAPTVDPADWYQIGWSPLFAVSLTTEAQFNAHGVLKPKGSGYYEFRRVSVTDGGTLWVYFSPDGANTQGEADIYALIAEPAA